MFPVGVAGPGGVLNVVSTPPPGPPAGPKGCPFQPGTGSSSVLANVMKAVLLVGDEPNQGSLRLREVLLWKYA